jgi:hypothetical protein
MSYETPEQIALLTRLRALQVTIQSSNDRAQILGCAQDAFLRAGPVSPFLNDEPDDLLFKTNSKEAHLTLLRLQINSVIPSELYDIDTVRFQAFAAISLLSTDFWDRGVSATGEIPQ